MGSVIDALIAALLGAWAGMALAIKAVAILLRQGYSMGSEPKGFVQHLQAPFCLLRAWLTR